MECCIHYESTSDTKLVELSSVESWSKLLAAAEIRKSAEILNLKDKEHVDYYYYLPRMNSSVLDVLLSMRVLRSRS